jgi:ABC-type iron transport system FetAB permease component
MRLFKPLAAMASLSLAASPVLAQSSAASLSLTQASLPTTESSQLDGGFIIPGIVLLAIVVGAIIVLADDDNDRPTSP